jgi:hypothetical protein
MLASCGGDGGESNPGPSVHRRLSVFATTLFFAYSPAELFICVRRLPLALSSELSSSCQLLEVGAPAVYESVAANSAAFILKTYVGKHVSLAGDMAQNVRNERFSSALLGGHFLTFTGGKHARHLH